MVTITTFHIEMLGVGYILYIVLNCQNQEIFQRQNCIGRKLLYVQN